VLSPAFSRFFPIFLLFQAEKANCSFPDELNRGGDVLIHSTIWRHWALVAHRTCSSPQARPPSDPSGSGWRTRCTASHFLSGERNKTNGIFCDTLSSTPVSHPPKEICVMWAVPGFAACRPYPVICNWWHIHALPRASTDFGAIPYTSTKPGNISMHSDEMG
jgi:hypothetical protein